MDLDLPSKLDNIEWEGLVINHLSEFKTSRLYINTIFKYNNMIFKPGDLIFYGDHASKRYGCILGFFKQTESWGGRGDAVFVIATWSNTIEEAKRLLSIFRYRHYYFTGWTLKKHDDKELDAYKHMSLNTVCLYYNNYVDKNLNKKEGYMIKVIADTFPVTADAVLVEKWFGKEVIIDSIKDLIFVKTYKDQILAICKDMEEASLKLIKK